LELRDKKIEQPTPGVGNGLAVAFEVYDGHGLALGNRLVRKAVHVTDAENKIVAANVFRD
jgi:hypothetical protein